MPVVVDVKVKKEKNIHEAHEKTIKINVIQQVFTQVISRLLSSEPRRKRAWL